MRLIDIIRLLALAAIWGGSFIFMRVLAPVLGAIPTANSRILIGGLVLCFYYLIIGFDPEFKKNIKQYLIIGVVNSAIPFSLYAYAALYIPASYEVILNSTAPLFGALFAWFWLDEKMDVRKISGLILAAIGVGVVVDIGETELTKHFVLSAAACLLAAICYGLAGVYIKKFAGQLKPKGIAGGSQLMGGIVLIPLTLTQHLHGPIDQKIILCMLGLALLCSAIAYLLYYQLIADIGPARALTVTFLMPIFGICWGKIFLDEIITFQMIIGTLLILLGTFYVVHKKVKIL